MDVSAMEPMLVEVSELALEDDADLVADASGLVTHYTLTDAQFGMKAEGRGGYAPRASVGS